MFIRPFIGCSLLLPAFFLPADLPIPDRGTLKLQMPPIWKEASRSTPPGSPPSLILERSGNPRGTLEITVIWSPKNDPDFTKEESLRSFTLAGQSAIRETTVEKELPLQSIRGLQGQGFYYTATDKTYIKPVGKPTPGEYSILTHGELGLGSVVLSFTIFSDAKDDMAVREALKALGSAGVQGVPGK